MTIVWMKRGEEVKRYTRPSVVRPLGGTTKPIDFSYASHATKMHKVFERFGDFIEDIDGTQDGRHYFGIIRNCGDNCIKIFSEV